MATVLIQGLSDEQLTDFELHLELATQAGLDRVMATIAEHIGKVRLAAMVSATVAGAAAVSPDDLAAIIPLWTQVVDEDLAPVVAQIYRDSAGVVHTGMIQAAGETVPQLTSPAVEAYLLRARPPLEDIGNDLWETARGQLIDGVQAGESIPEIATRLRDSAGMTGRRATGVARTSVLEASNAGSYDTARASGLDLEKGWEATPDFRTRETHLMAGSTYSGPGMIPLAENFMVGGWPAERPHDPELPPEERYNCRCTIVYRVREVPQDPYQAAIDSINAEHQAKLAAINAKQESRLARAQAKYEEQVAKIEASTPVNMSIAEAAAYREKMLANADAKLAALRAKLIADHEAYKAKLDAHYDYKIAQTKGATMPPSLELPPQPPPLATLPLPEPPIVAPPALPAKAVDIPIRASLQQAKTVAEVRKAFIQEWQRIVKDNPGAIRGAARFFAAGDVQTAREHAEGLLRAIERFPMVRLDVGHTSTTAWAETHGYVIEFSQEFAVVRDDYLLSLRLSGIADPTGVAWHPLSLTTPQGVSLHEFGHALGHSVARGPSGYYDYIAHLRLNKDIEQLGRILATERGLAYDDLIRTEIGGYATTNAYELAAEAFADVMVNGDAASELSKRIFAMLVKKYEAQHGPMPHPSPLTAVPRLAAKPKPPPATELVAPSEQRFALAVDRGASGDGYAPSGQWGRYGGGGVLIRADTSAGPRFLLVQRGPTVSSNQGLWQLPGGAIDELETVYQGIARETIEELAATESYMSSLTPLAEHVFTDPTGSGWKYTSVIARAPKKFAPKVDGTETGAARWFSREQIEKMLADGKIVPELDQRIADLIGGFEKFAKATVADDGLDKMTVAALKALAQARNIQNAAIPKMTKAELIQLIRLSAEADRQLANAIAEAIDLVERVKLTKGFEAAVSEAKRLLSDYRGGELAYLKIQNTPSHGANQLIQRLRNLAQQRGLTLPVGDELQAVRAARVAAAKEAAAAARKAKAEAAAIQRQVKAIERGDFSGFTRVGAQQGSNPGGVFVDASGQKWYVKESTEEWAREQQLAASLYNLILRDAAHKDWFSTPPVIIGQGTPGLSRWQVATRIIEADRDLEDKLLANEAAYIAQIREGFAVDAWLANWDVAGATFDNIVTYGGRPIRIDVGGTLRFRAQGGAKGSAFGDDVLEWDTLRDAATSPTGSRIFAGMTDNDLRRAVEKLKGITPARIQAMVRAHGLDDKLAVRLIARRQYILDLAERELDITGNFRQQLAIALRGNKALNAPPVRLEVRGWGSSTVHGLADPHGEISDALREYRGFEHERINGGLRQGRVASSEVRGWINRLDEALDQSVLPEPVYGFRGVAQAEKIFGPDPAKWGDLVGFEWQEGGYGSISTSVNIARGFTFSWGQQTPVLFNVLAPRGTLAVRLSGTEYERELLLDRDLIWRVVRDRGKDKTGRRIIDVEIVGRPGPRRSI